jgi:GT2 family glycosyltransferase
MIAGPSKPRVTVVVLPRESFAHALRSLESLYADPGIEFELLYMDGATPRALRSKLQAEARVRGFRLVPVTGPVTPNRLRNLGARMARTEFVAFVDNDVLFAADWLGALVRCADETSADVVGPLICIGDPPFRRVHSAGGDSYIGESPAGRSFHESHRFIDVPLDDAVRASLVREPMNLVEFHCMLVRSAIFDRIGPLDEQLSSAGEHSDLCMTVRAAGGRIMFEPSSMVNQFLPLLFPRDLASLPFFLSRWSPRRNAQSLTRLCEKYRVGMDDPGMAGYAEWLAKRNEVMFASVLNPLRRLPLLQPLRRPYRAAVAKLRELAAGSANGTPLPAPRRTVTDRVSPGS